MPGAYGEIIRVLQGARRRQVRIVLLAGLGFGLAAALFSLLAGAAALALGARPGLRGFALSGALAGGLAAAVLVVRALVRSAWDTRAAARTVGQEEPALRSALLSSVELAAAREEIAQSGRFSLALVDAHLDATAARARTVDLRRVVPDRLARRAGLALLAVLALYGASFVAGGGALGRAFGRVLVGEPLGAAPPKVDPITGDIELTYAYPAYMRRDPRTLSGTGGEIRAPKGTEVTLRTRADRPVTAAEIAIEYAVAPAAPRPEVPASAGHGELGPSPPSTPGDEPRGAAPPPATSPIVKRYALAVAGDRDLSGRFVVEEGGSYRFRFLAGRGKVVAEGPPIPIALEPDAFPEVRITAPEREIEVSAGAVVHVEWQAEDDFGVAEVVLVVKPPAGEVQRRILRRGASFRRDAGTADLALAPEKLAEGERLSYWMEALDTDTISGPKKSASETHTVKIYSEAEHRRQVLARAKQVYEELVSVLGDRLDTFAAGSVATSERLVIAQALDARVRALHQHLRDVASEIRRDRAGPREVAAALQNVAAQLRVAEQRLTSSRNPLAQAHRMGIRPDPSLVRTMALFDGQLDQELEKGILYLEQLLDKRRAEDLLALAKDLAARRRDLAGIMEKYRASPTESAKKELLAEVARMKERVKDLLARMAELSKGFNDEHMNEEALAELARSQDLAGGLDEVEKKLAAGDVEGAMKALDQMASAMDKMVAGLQRTAGMPDEKAKALMKEMLAFKDQIEKVESEQKQTAADTEKVRAEYRKKIAERMKDAERKLAKLSKLAAEARKDVEGAQQGVTMRAEPEYELAKEALKDLERALSMKELDGAGEAVQRAEPAVQRLSMLLEEDAAFSQRAQGLTNKPPDQIEDAKQKTQQAIPKVNEIRDELRKLLPDPREVLSKEDQKRLGELSRRQGELERKAGELQGKLQELSQKAPVFPPSAQGQLGESRGHMGQAAGELEARNPQRGHGEQELAMDALARFKKGLEEAAKRGGGQSGGQGFPFPFAESGGEQSGDGADPSHEKVKIPGAEAHKAPEEFRKDLLEAMKQGSPERYRGEVQRYYEELVK